ncbi:SDR family NAD(P)-dependent oxidoreductase [Sphingomonas sp. 1P08PE]|uniref:SDR family NAD(P)-dependent oxidoreductase n=1 Tax=Sphingomonas sp. 1P08PE TaxID=554122 RepID=UPI00399F6B49
MTLARNSVVVVTGGASGLGRATCRRFAEEGARAVIVADLQPEPREGGETSIDIVTGLGAKARFVRTDVTQAADVGLAIQAAEEFGGVTTLVTFAGILQNGPFLDIDEDTLDKVLAINVKGSFLIAQAAARSMIAGGRHGSIVLVSSIGGARGSGASVAYSASKGAVMLMAHAMADALASDGIRVNVLHPGLIRTAMTEGVDADELGWRIALDRPGRAEEVANAALFLSSPLASYVTATSLLVDGGMVNIL